MLRTLIIPLLFAATPAWAVAPELTGASGASAYIATGTTSYTIYGGLAGNQCSGNTNTEVCNNCDDALTCTNQPLCPCNTARIWDGLILRISVKSVNESATLVAQVGSGTNVNTDIIPVSATATTIDLSWSALCNAMGAATCEAVTGTQSLTLRLAFDKNGDGKVTANTAGEEVRDVVIKAVKPTDGTYEVIGSAGNSGEGITAFKPYPGDEKVYLENIQSSSGFPLFTYGTRAKKVRVFFSDTNMDDAIPLRAPYDPVNIDLVDNGDNLDGNNVDGLKNDQLYFFRLGLVDEAENVVQFIPDPASLSANCTTAPDSGCIYSATPSEVLGLLSKDLNCFIASAAYGSSLEPKLQVFRDFRYKILLQNKWGLEFVEAYYKYGPYAARYISDKPVLQAVTRALLWPLYGFSYLALKVGFAAAFAASLLFLTALIGLPWYGFRRALKRA